MKTRIDMSPQPSTSNSIDVSAKMQTDDECFDAESHRAQMKSTGDDIALLGKRHRIMRREVDSSECKEEAANYNESEAELVEVADTLKRAIF